MANNPPPIGLREHDTLNRFAVAIASANDDVVILRGDHVRRMSHAEALNLAAWLVAVNNHSRAEFLALLDAIEAA